MTCPFCDQNLRAAEREGIELEYCPQCGGVCIEPDEFESLVLRFQAREWEAKSQHRSRRAAVSRQ